MNYTPPGPGSWILDAAHCERPHSRYVTDFFGDLYTRGFREGFARYGILLDTIELQFVDGFAYQRIAPLGAPPGATGPPPRPVFWLLTRLHPALRRRIREAGKVFAEKRWRADVDHFFDEQRPRWRKRLAEFAADKPGALSDDQLVDHLARAKTLIAEVMYDHFSAGPVGFIPVGDFALACTDWTGCDAREAIDALTGASPHSLDALEIFQRLAEAIRTAGVSLEGDPSEVLDKLRSAEGEVGVAAQVWLDEVGERIFTGHDVAELRVVERPKVMLDALIHHVQHPDDTTSESSDTPDAAKALRQRVPEAHRGAFDDLLAEARYAHQMRDGHSSIDFWAMGLVRRAILEVGRRLVDAGRLHNASDAVDLTHDEQVAALRGQGGPSADEVAGWVHHRESLTCSDMPDVLGPEPGDPPPPEWLPEQGARVARAMQWYLESMFAPRESKAPEAGVVGIGASPGHIRARARLVSGPEDFGRVQQGDVLIARITTTAYNVLLPLLGGVVTERGGLLSHPAIVAREYGIPGVVAARGALSAIPDGATVEVDGVAGTVRVVA